MGEIRQGPARKSSMSKHFLTQVAKWSADILSASGRSPLSLAQESPSKYARCARADRMSTLQYGTQRCDLISDFR
jgi:hypothetical protein